MLVMTNKLKRRFKNIMDTLKEAIKKIRDELAMWERYAVVNKLVAEWDDEEPKPPNPQRPSLTHTARMECINRRNDVTSWEGEITFFRDLDPPSKGGAVTLWPTGSGSRARLTVGFRRKSQMPNMPQHKVGIYRTVNALLDGTSLATKDLPRGAKRKLKELYPVMVLLLQDDE